MRGPGVAERVVDATLARDPRSSDMSPEADVYRTIIVPLDGSAFAEQALPCAAMLARTYGARLCLAHVHVPMPSTHLFEVPLVTHDDFETEIVGRVREYLAGVATRYANAGVQVETALATGRIASELRTIIERYDGDLVVMTTHGRGGMARFWIGSSADQLVRETHVPMLLLRPIDEDATDLQPPDFRRILVTLDGSRESEQILAHAIALSQSGGIELRLLRVVPPRVPMVYPSPRNGEQRSDELEQEALSYLGGIAADVQSESIKVTVDVITHVNPALAVLEYAKRESVDLIAMATHGRGGVRRMVLGSVTDKVLRGTALPMLLLRPD